MKVCAVLIVSLLVFLFAIQSCSGSSITVGEFFSETEITTPVMVHDVTALATASLEITYDPSVLLVTAATESAFSSLFANLQHAEEGWVSIGAYQVGGGLPPGDVKFVELTIAPRGSYGSYTNVDLSLNELYDNNHTAIEATVVDGFFYIGMNGDVLADRVINAADSEYIARGIAGVPGNPPKFGPSEVSGDGIVDAYDCVYLARHAAGVPGYETLH
jgi:hypothetical protein